MSAFTTIDLSLLPAPEIIEQLDFETIFAARKARLIEIAEGFGDQEYLAALTAALDLESEPIVQLLQEDSYRELILRAAFQDGGKGMLLAFATGATLDHLAAYFGVERQVVQEADDTVTPPIEEVMESDERLRARVQLAPEGFTTAGSVGSYIFLALAASAEVKDVDVRSPRFARAEISAEIQATLPDGAIVLIVEDDAGLDDPLPGDVAMRVLSTEGDGTADANLLAAVDATTEPRRPLTDRLRTEAATIVPYTVEAELTLYDGPDMEVVRQASEDAVRAFVDKHHALGHDITIAGLHAALYRDGVQDVVITSPAGPLVIDAGSAAYCTSISVTAGGRDV